MNGELIRNNLKNSEWVAGNLFSILAEISCLLDVDENNGRDLLIRALEYRQLFERYNDILIALIEKAGLFPYIEQRTLENLSTKELLAYEFHKPIGMREIVLHSVQAKVYRMLLDGENIILSAPTSFGKSLLIDAMIASGKFKVIVIIVPTIALIDETRRRLTEKFGHKYKIITHPTQEAAEKCIYILTQERLLEFGDELIPNFFVIDEFYKLHGDEADSRTYSLNIAFYKLRKSGAQYFLIGPNIQKVETGDKPIDFKFYRTDFSTVATEIIRVNAYGSLEAECLKICKKVKDPTLIFCKSSGSAYKLASFLIENNVKTPNKHTELFAEWLCQNYHPDWELVNLVKNGIAIHHGSLPRSIAQMFLHEFNEGRIKFLLCTSTIIEGVNTSAKNIIIYDNKIANEKFDFFTFNNIKGRAGRMFKYFVGHVYVLNDDPQEELPFVDIPVISAPDDMPQELSIYMDSRDLSEYSLQQLRYLHAQDYLSVDVIKKNTCISPDAQIRLAKQINDKPHEFSKLLSWNDFPNRNQLQTVCNLIFDFFMEGKRKDDIVSAKQLNYKIRNLSCNPQIQELIKQELGNAEYCKSPTDAVEKTLGFLRRWGEYNFPRYLSALSEIQKFVLQRAGLPYGDYSNYSSKVKQWFMPLAATVLEEYGIPFQIALKIESQFPLGDNVDEIIFNLHRIDVSKITLSDIEREMLLNGLKSL